MSPSCRIPILEGEAEEARYRGGPAQPHSMSTPSLFLGSSRSRSSPSLIELELLSRPEARSVTTVQDKDAGVIDVAGSATAAARRQSEPWPPPCWRPSGFATGHSIRTSIRRRSKPARQSAPSPGSRLSAMGAYAAGRMTRDCFFLGSSQFWRARASGACRRRQAFFCFDRQRGAEVSLSLIKMSHSIHGKPMRGRKRSDPLCRAIRSQTTSPIAILVPSTRHLVSGVRHIVPPNSSRSVQRPLSNQYMHCTSKLRKMLSRPCNSQPEFDSTLITTISVASAPPPTCPSNAWGADRCDVGGPMNASSASSAFSSECSPAETVFARGFA